MSNIHSSINFGLVNIPVIMNPIIKIMTVLLINFIQNVIKGLII